MELLKRMTFSTDKEDTDITSGTLVTVSGALSVEEKTRDARAKAFALQDIIKDEEQLEIEIDHLFCEGVYARTMLMPKGSVIIGKIHKHKQLNMLIKGDVTVAMEDGPVRVQAGFRKVCPAGAKRVFYAHEDSIWTVVVHTFETDIDKIDKHFVLEDSKRITI